MKYLEKFRETNVCMKDYRISNSNVRSENKYTKRSSNTLLRLVYLFSERTLRTTKIAQKLT